jgi:hypothetical protein
MRAIKHHIEAFMKELNDLCECECLQVKQDSTLGELILIDASNDKVAVIEPVENEFTYHLVEVLGEKVEKTK